MEANTYFIWEFVFASVLMAIGIGMDVAIVTVSRAASLQCRRLAVVWVVGVTLTHTLLPMFGYLFTYYSIKLHPFFTPAVGLMASGLILFYLVTELKAYSSSVDDELSTEPQESWGVNPQGSTGQMPTFSRQQLFGTVGLIIAVSWDALWSGPAKSAQVTDWPEYWVWSSFVVVGFIISLLSVAALKLGYSIYKVMINKSLISSCSNAEVSKSIGGLNGQSTLHKLSMGRFITALIQFGVIGYFGLLAVTTYTFGVVIPWWLLLQLSFTCVMVALLIVGNQSSASRAVT